MSEFIHTGELFVVATPIGNLKDITLRALDILKTVDFIACEDTRKTALLCSEYEIKAKLVSYHDHNKEIKGQYLISELESGKKIALVSDAGTPGINDPGYNVIRDALEKQIKVSALPGACAAIQALVSSGCATDRFCYEGFLPVKKGRQTALNRLKEEERTIVIYESVHRIAKTMEELAEIFSSRTVCVLREMTKIYEERFFGTAVEVCELIKNSTIKGEYVIIINGISAKDKKTEKKNKYANLKNASFDDDENNNDEDE